MAWIDDTIFRYSGNNLSVMLYLITHMDDEGVCTIGARTIAKDLGITYQSVGEAIKRLIKKGDIYEKDDEGAEDITTHFTTHFTTHPPKSLIVCEYDSYTKPKKKQQRTLQRTLQRTPLAPIEERTKAFYNELVPYVDSQGGKYPPSMVREFFNYWSEPNQTNTRMRFELQQTWRTAARLSTWARKNNIFDDNNIFIDNNIKDNSNWQ